MCVLFFDPVHCVGHDVGRLRVCMFMFSVPVFACLFSHGLQYKCVQV